MQRRRVLSAAASVAMLGIVVIDRPSAHADHAGTGIDTTRTLTLEGTVKSLKWENRHASLLLETVDGGARVAWTVPMSGLARMDARGVDADTFAVGKVLTILASPRPPATSLASCARTASAATARTMSCTDPVVRCVARRSAAA